MSVYLLAPANVLLAVKMLKYIEVIRRLDEQGGNWQSYDEVFRSLRCSRGWAWDFINWEHWFRAAQEKATVSVRQTSGSPFQVKGKAKSPSQGNCYPYNRGEMCDKDTCRYWHKCRFCQGPHPFVHCYKAQGTRQRPNQQRPNQQHPNTLTNHPLRVPQVDPLLGLRSKLPSPISSTVLTHMLQGYDVTS